MISAVFFDLGGTLFHHLPRQSTLDNLAWALQTQGVTQLPKTAFDRYPRLRAELEQRYAERPFFLHRELVLDAARCFLDPLQAAHSLTIDVERFARSFYALQRSAVTEHLVPREDAAHVLQTLRGWGYYVAIVSNIDEDYLGPLLARVPDFAACDLILSSELCKSCKPDPAIFREALARSGFGADEVLYVGDSKINDVMGAGRLGFRTAWLIADQSTDAIAATQRARDDNPGASTEPDLLLCELADLLTILPRSVRR